jgi:uncharacterized protein (DUF1697 family)
MPAYIALLRGINVGGHNKVAMFDLRAVAQDLGHGRVATYIQSGNLVFTSDRADPAGLADELEQEIAARLGVKAPVVVVSGAELAEVIAANPFPADASPRTVHAVFRRDEMSPEGHAAVAEASQAARAAGSRDEAVVVGRTLYLSTPDGLGRSDLAARLARSAAQSAGTARNWATVTRLAAMLDAAGQDG